MSKFLTVPVWYDKNGRLNQMLTGDAKQTNVGANSNIAIGEGSVAGVAGSIGKATVIGYNAKGEKSDATVIGANASAEEGGIAIGSEVNATNNGIAIGGDASSNEVQLGNKATNYALQVGNGNGTAKIGTLVLGNAVTPTSISSVGLYLCTASMSASGIVSWVSGLIWIGDVTAKAYAANGSVSFEYDGNRTITCKGATLGQCFKIFQN